MRGRIAAGDGSGGAVKVDAVYSEAEGFNAFQSVPDRSLFSRLAPVSARAVFLTLIFSVAAGCGPMILIAGEGYPQKVAPLLPLAVSRIEEAKKEPSVSEILRLHPVFAQELKQVRSDGQFMPSGYVTEEDVLVRASYRLAVRAGRPVDDDSLVRALKFDVAVERAFDGTPIIDSQTVAINIFQGGDFFEDVEPRVRELEEAAGARAIMKFMIGEDLDRAMKTIAHSRGPLFIFMHGHGRRQSISKVAIGRIAEAIAKRGHADDVFIVGDTCFGADSLTLLSLLLAERGTGPLKGVLSSNDYNDVSRSYWSHGGFTPLLLSLKSAYFNDPVRASGRALLGMHFRKAVIVPYMDGKVVKQHPVLLVSVPEKLREEWPFPGAPLSPGPTQPSDLSPR